MNRKEILKRVRDFLDASEGPTYVALAGTINGHPASALLPRTKPGEFFPPTRALELGTLLLHAAAQPFSDAPDVALAYLEDCLDNLRQHYRAGFVGTPCGSVEEMKMEPTVGPKQ